MSQPFNIKITLIVQTKKPMKSHILSGNRGNRDIEKRIEWHVFTSIFFCAIALEFWKITIWVGKELIIAKLRKKTRNRLYKYFIYEMKEELNV